MKTRSVLRSRTLAAGGRASGGQDLTRLTNLKRQNGVARTRSGRSQSFTNGKEPKRRITLVATRCRKGRSWRLRFPMVWNVGQYLRDQIGAFEKYQMPLVLQGSARFGGLRKLGVCSDLPTHTASRVVHSPLRSNASLDSRLRPNRHDDRDPDSAEDVGAGIQPCNIFVVLERPMGFEALFFNAGTPACPWRWIQPRLRINRPIWSRWYFTPKRRSMTSAMRAVVQGSVLYPFARAPLRNSPSNCLHWPASSLSGRPGGVRTFSAVSPPRSQACCHRSTELAAHSTMRATSRSEHPWLRSRKAWRRRSSSKSAEPFMRAIEVLRTGLPQYGINGVLQCLYRYRYNAAQTMSPERAARQRELLLLDSEWEGIVNEDRRQHLQSRLAEMLRAYYREILNRQRGTTDAVRKDSSES